MMYDVLCTTKIEIYNILNNSKYDEILCFVEAMKIMVVMLMMSLLVIVTGLPPITTSIKDFVQIFGTEYYVEEEFDVSCVKKLSNLVAREYGGSLDGLLDKIIVFKDSEETIVDGLYVRRIIAVSSSRISSFHHELTHFILANYLDFDAVTERWIGLNNYPYVGDGWDGMRRRQGYVSTYAMSSLEEDVAETFRELMTMEGRKGGLMYDDIMMRKFYVLRDLVLGIGSLKSLGNIVVNKVNEMESFSYWNYLNEFGERDELTPLPNNMVKVDSSLGLYNLAISSELEILCANGLIMQLPRDHDWYACSMWGSLSNSFGDLMEIIVSKKMRYQVRGSFLESSFRRGYFGVIKNS